MTAPFRGSGPWRGRGPFLGRGPWAGKAPFGFNAGLPFQINVTGAQLRDALADPTAWGTTGSATGWLLPGLGGARLSGDCRTSVAMQTLADGTVGYAVHNLRVGSADTLWVGAGGGGQTNALTTEVAPFIAGTVVQKATRGSLGDTNVAGLDVAAPGAGRQVTGSVYVWLPSGQTYTEVRPSDDESLSSPTYVLANLSLRDQWQRISVTGVTLAGNPICVLRAICSAGTILYHTAWQYNLGPTALPYVPTGASARFGPAIDWLAGIGAYGIRSESARTNLVLYSADMGNAAWLTYGAGATKVGAATALGAVPMYRINVGTLGGDASAASAIYQNAGSVAAATTYTVSAIVRAVSGTSAFRLVGMTDAATYVGSSTLTATTTPQLFQFQFTTAAGSPFTVYLSVRAATAGGVVGDIEVGGFQLEAGTEASSPILTYAAAATRAADTLVVLDSGWINQSEGTIVADGSFTRIAGNGPLLSLRSGNAVGVQIGRNSGGGGDTELDAYVQDTGDQAWLRFAANVVAGQRYRVACAYQVNNFAASAAGLTTLVDTSGTVPAMTELRLGKSPGSAELNGHLTRIRYSRRRASNGQLQALTV